MTLHRCPDCLHSARTVEELDKICLCGGCRPNLMDRSLPPFRYVVSIPILIAFVAFPLLFLLIQIP